MEHFRRYDIHTEPAHNLTSHPNRYRVRVRHFSLLKLLIKEFFQYRGNMEVVLSRPCVYGVFSAPVGGFRPIEEKCVGCLRCTVQYPDIVEVLPNPDRLTLGDSYFTPSKVETVLYEAATGRVPVKGAGYRGGFGGSGWDGMWTDMSEIVRPTRDGIHGREFISTSVDLGRRPGFLVFNPEGEPEGDLPEDVSVPIPWLFDALPNAIETERTYRALVQAAEKVGSLAVIPLEWILRLDLDSRAVAPLVTAEEAEAFGSLERSPEVVELDGWDDRAYRSLTDRFPGAQIFARLPFGTDLLPLIERGVRQFHLTADYSGATDDGFVMDAIQGAHETLVDAGVREQVTVLGSGGIVAAEHLPKAIICGLDAVALDSVVWVAWQGRLLGECRTRRQAQIDLPAFDVDWAAQRLVNLSGSWRDQLLEILGAMGLREVRRLRGEIGRAMLQPRLEAEAFSGIQGFGS